MQVVASVFFCYFQVLDFLGRWMSQQQIMYDITFEKKSLELNFIQKWILLFERIHSFFKSGRSGAFSKKNTLGAARPLLSYFFCYFSYPRKTRVLAVTEWPEVSRTLLFLSRSPINFLTFYYSLNSLNYWKALIFLCENEQVCTF